MKAFDPVGPESLRNQLLREQEEVGIRTCVLTCGCRIEHPVGEPRNIARQCSGKDCTRPDNWATVEW